MKNTKLHLPRSPVNSIFDTRNSHLPSPDSPFESRHSSLPLALRSYQRAAFENRTNGIECWLWGRQTGKSFTLAAWAIDRLVTRPGRLVTILSNSLVNGAELNHKCAEIARLYEQAFSLNPNLNLTPNLLPGADSPTFIEQNFSPDLRFECMNYEIRFINGDIVSRIKILPANPRTARGFSGDLILDEFAFHENSAAIWEAAEPILSANPDFLCRIASTPNGRHNMFYRLATDPAIPMRIVPRSEAWRQGLIIAHPVTRKPITPQEARALAVDKRAYDQNYECIFEAENMSLLSLDLISQAEDPTVGHICDDQWSPAALDLLAANSTSPTPDNLSLKTNHLPLDLDLPLTTNPLPLSPYQPSNLEPSTFNSASLRPSTSSLRNYYVGIDVGRTQDLTVISVIEKASDLFLVRAILRLRNLRLPAQQELLEIACRSPRFASAQIDMTGIGLGLFEYTHQRFGGRIRGLNFASTVTFPKFALRNSTLDIAKAKVPEVLALGLLQHYESKRIRHPIDPLLREDLRKPERVTSSDGRVSIVASRDKNGHADHFWSLALAVDAALRTPAPQFHVPTLRNFLRIPRNRFC
jgi:phage FluMu gp28-like protein